MINEFKIDGKNRKEIKKKLMTKTLHILV